MKRFLLPIGLWVSSVALVAQAEERKLQIQLETQSGSEPTQLCLVSRFVPAAEKGQSPESARENLPRYRQALGGTCQWGERLRGECKLEEPYAQQLASNGLCAPNTNPPIGDKEFQWCERKLVNRAERILVLSIDSGVTGASLTHQLLQLTLNPATASKNSLAIRTIGGDYLDTAVASHRDPDGSDRALLAIVPLCASSHVVIPRYECPGINKHPLLTLRNGGRQLSVSFNQLPDAIDLPLPQASEHGGSLELSDCDGSLKLAATWLQQPPPEIALKPQEFPVLWRRDPLSAAACPGELSLPEVPLRCRPPTSKEGTPIPHAPGDDNVCQYSCVSVTPIDLPTAVAFQENVPTQLSGESGAAPIYNRWEARLLQPGDTLDGYLRPEQRFITLQHDAWRPKRDERKGDRITSIWIATPDGKAQSVATNTPRLFVPGVSAGDHVTYRYFGDRLFETATAPVESGGIVKLKDPDQEYARGVQPGLAFWGGWRHLGGAKDATEWNPVGGMELVLAVPAWRTYTCNEDWYFEPEFHLGATVTTQSYESIFQATPLDARSDSSKNVMILLVPLEVSVRAPLGIDQLQVDLGAGLAWYRAFYTEDTARLAPNIAVSLPRATLLWRITRGFTFGFDSRLLSGFGTFGLHSRRVVETFDLGGRLSRRELGSKMLLFGLVTRFDDVF